MGLVGFRFTSREVVRSRFTSVDDLFVGQGVNFAEYRATIDSLFRVLNFIRSIRNDPADI